MNPTRILVFAIPLSILAAVAMVGSSCGPQKVDATPLQPGAGLDPGSKKNHDSDGDGDGGDAAKPRELSTPAQAVQVLLTAYDGEIAENQIASKKTQNPDVKKFADDSSVEMNAVKKRLQDLIASKKISPADSLMSDRMGFETSASISHLSNLFPNMFDRTYMNRRVDDENAILHAIDDEITPSVADDDDLKKEAEQAHKDSEARLGKAQALLDALPDFGFDSGLMIDVPPPAPAVAAGDASVTTTESTSEGNGPAAPQRSRLRTPAR